MLENDRDGANVTKDMLYINGGQLINQLNLKFVALSRNENFKL